jgi:hypothetical protein
MFKRFFILFLLASLGANAATLIVTSLNTAGPGSLRKQILMAAPGDTIRFSPTLLANGSDTIHLGLELDISKQLVIKGLFTATDTLYISGEGTNRIFHLNYTSGSLTNHKLVLDSLALVNGFSNSHGGGVFYNYGDSLLIFNTTIKNCSSTKNGGGVYAKADSLRSSMVRLRNVRFVNNSAARSGGGLYVHNTNLAAIRSCRFYSNQADSGAGMAALSRFNGNAVVNVIESTFKNNDADDYGGGVFLDDINLSRINHSFFTSNSAVDGGAVYGRSDQLSNINIRMFKSVLRNNQSTDQGGGAYLFKVALFNMDSCRIAGNSANFGGGILCTAFVNTPYTSYIRNSSIDSNTATYHGGGISMDHAKLLHFKNASLNYNSGGTGGAIDYTGCEKLVARNFRMGHNTSTGHAGGLWSSADTLVMDSIYVYYNQSSPYGNGGGMNLFSYKQLLIDSAWFEGNVTSGYGGGLTMNAYYYSYPNYITNSVFKENQAQYGGGMNSTNINLINVAFVENHALGNGGAYQCTNVNSRVTMTDCSLSRNRASLYWGGGICLENASLTLRNTTLDSNVSASYGGGIYSSYADSVEVINCTFSGNKADEGAGIYDHLSSGYKIINSTITQNYGATSGGGIHLESGNTPTLITSTILANNSSTNFYRGNASPVTSGGYNVFEDNTMPGSIGTDQLGVSNAQLALGALQYNGGYGLTHLPDTISLAVNRGNPADLTPAQNGPIVYIRDAGSTETLVPVIVGDTSLVSGCDSVLVHGSYILNAGYVRDTLTSTSGLDSIHTTLVTLYDSYVAVDSVSACKSFTWINGNTYTASNQTDSVLYTTVHGCDSIIYLNLTINPNLDVTQNGAVLTALQAGANYQWLYCDSSFLAIPGATAQTFTATQIGDYAVEISKAGCIDTTLCYYVSQVGLAEVETGMLLKVYPNPGSGVFTVQAELKPTITQVHLAVYSTVGVQVYAQNVALQNGKLAEMLDLNALPNGQYVLHIRWGNQTVYHKLVLQK